jgi:DnaJ like chaperone protein
VAKLLSIILIGACMWATIDMVQSKNTGLTKILWIASFWIFSLIALPVYYFIARNSNQLKPKFGSAAWGSIIGLMFAGPIGAIAGAYLGHSFEKGKDVIDERSVFQINLISILSYVVKVDGEVAKSEVDTVLQLFQRLGFGVRDIAMMTRAFEAALGQDVDLKTTCENFRKCSRYEERLMLLRMVYMVVMADQKFHAKEKEAIAHIVDFLGIQPDDHMSIQAEYHKTADKYYEILGLTRGATLAELKKSYRNLALKHHPDRVGHLGEEYRHIAEKDFKKISEAYQVLLKELAGAK